MPNKKTKPSVEEILELYEDCKNRYEESGLWGQFEQDETFYELDFHNLLLLPEEFKKEGIILPTARDIVDISVDHTDISNARVWVGKRGDSAKSEDDANLLRKFGLGVLYRNNIESSLAPLRAGAKHYWLHGLTVLKTVWDADRWVDRPERTEDESESQYAIRIDEWRASHHDSLPIVMQAVHPRNILLDPYYNGGTFVFEVTEELCFNVGQKYPNWGNPLGKKTSGKVEHISFWTNKYRCELYDREPILKVSGGVAAHSYGFIPYVPIDTGLGNVSSDNDLQKRYVGVLRYVRDLIVSESRDYSIGDVILKRNAFPWGYLKGPNAASVSNIFQKFGEYNPMPDGVEIIDMAPKLPPDALLQWMSTASNYLASHAAPNVVRGMGETGVRSGADRRLLIAEASTRYQYSNEAFKNGVAKVLSNCARIMKNVVPDSVNVWARTPTDEFDIEVKKEDLKEPFTFYVEFSPISEEDEYRRHDDLERLYKGGLVTKQWVRKQMSNVDFQAMELEEEIEKLKNDPMVQQVVSQYFAAKMAEAIAKRGLADSAAQPQSLLEQKIPVESMGEPGRRMEAPIPNVAPPGSAQEMQNQMAALRSQSSMTQQGMGGGGNRR